MSRNFKKCSILKAQSIKNRALQDFNQGRLARGQKGVQKIMNFDFIGNQIIQSSNISLQYINYQGNFGDVEFKSASKKALDHSMGQYWTLDLKYWAWTELNRQDLEIYRYRVFWVVEFKSVEKKNLDHSLPDFQLKILIWLVWNWPKEWSKIFILDGFEFYDSKLLLNDIFEGPFCLVLPKSSSLNSKSSTDPGSDSKFFFQRVQILHYKLDQYTNFECPDIIGSVLECGLLLTLLILPRPDLTES